MADHRSGAPAPAGDDNGRRSGADRRQEQDRRRSARGLFELRARREGVSRDRRQQDRRDERPGSWLSRLLFRG